MIFFFDEAHIIFDDMSKVLRQKFEQIIKLIRSKGVGIYFCTQNPRDIPDEVLAQLGNKIQHALHAYTPAEERAVKTAADSFRANPEFDTKSAIMELGVGEALVSVLDEEGVPTIVERCKILPPRSLMGTISDDERRNLYVADNLYIKYKDPVDPDSAYEFLERLKSKEELAAKEAAQAALEEKEAAKREAEEAKAQAKAEQEAAKAEAARKRKVKSAAGSVASSAAGTIGREFGKSIGGKVGGKFGKTIGGNIAAQLGRSIMGTFFR